MKNEQDWKFDKDKACERLENLSYVRGMGQVGMNFKEWKEWLKENA